VTCFQVQADPASFSAFGVNALDRATRAASAQACGGPLPSRMMVGLSGPPKIADREAPDALIAEHGFSMLVTVTKAGYQHRVPFDAGTSPIGVAERMRRLDIDPTDLEADRLQPRPFRPHHRSGRPAAGAGAGGLAGADPPALLAAARGRLPRSRATHRQPPALLVVCR